VLQITYGCWDLFSKHALAVGAKMWEICRIY